MIKRHGLSVQLFFSVVCSLLVAALVFFLCFSLGVFLLDQAVYGDAIVKKMTDQQFSNLQEYVLEEQVTSKNLRPLDLWCSRGDRVYLVLYVDDQLFYESFTPPDEPLDPESFDPSFEDPNLEYALYFSDGVLARAFLYYYAGDAYSYGNVVISGLIAFLVFSLCFIGLIHRKLRYIQLLRQELEILAGGDLSYPVTVRGQDELSQLATGIDEMRRSISAHQAAEEQIRQANSQLVTTMSHDLRTPLTSLLAYLELMDRGKYQDAQQLSHFIHRCLEKTLQIKSMADQLFSYFLVYSTEEAPSSLEPAEADSLLRPLWEEYAFSLESHGFPVQRQFPELHGFLRVDLSLLRRAFDNLYSNLLKYADPATPVEIAWAQKGGALELTLSNAISSSRERQESTHIGLNTCRQLLRLHGGTIQFQEMDNRFLVTLRLPLYSTALPAKGSAR